MTNSIPIAKPMIGDDEIKAVEAVLRSGMLAMGEHVARFEEEFSQYLGVRNSISTSNGTTALDLALKSLDLQPGDEVITPAFTFIASANCILYQGCKPVFADVERKTFNIDPEDLLEKITPKTKAVVGVHLYGQPFDISAVSQICQDHKLHLVEDCAQAHGAMFKGSKVGTFGIGCFSFYPTKNMTTGEGGMVTTNDDEISKRLRLLRSHGDTGKYNHVSIGYNFRMTNIQGALGLVQLRKLEAFTKSRIANARMLNERIRAKGITVPYESENVRHVYHQYAITVEDDFPASREKLMEYLSRRGVGCSIHYPKAVYEHPVYRERGYAGRICPVSEEVSRRVLSLPVHPSLSIEDIEAISKALNEFEA